MCVTILTERGASLFSSPLHYSSSLQSRACLQRRRHRGRRFFMRMKKGSLREPTSERASRASRQADGPMCTLLRTHCQAGKLERGFEQAGFHAMIIRNLWLFLSTVSFIACIGYSKTHNIGNPNLICNRTVLPPSNGSCKPNLVLLSAANSSHWPLNNNKGVPYQPPNFFSKTLERHLVLFRASVPAN